MPSPLDRAMFVGRRGVDAIPVANGFALFRGHVGRGHSAPSGGTRRARRAAQLLPHCPHLSHYVPSALSPFVCYGLRNSGPKEGIGGRIRSMAVGASPTAVDGQPTPAGGLAWMAHGRHPSAGGLLRSEGTSVFLGGGVDSKIS